MRDSAYIVVTAKGISRMVKKSRPTMKAGEYAILVTIGVPDFAFRPRPIAEATLEVGVEQMIAPPVLVEQIDPEDTSRTAPPAVPLEDDPDFQAGLREG